MIGVRTRINDKINLKDKKSECQMMTTFDERLLKLRRYSSQRFAVSASISEALIGKSQKNRIN